MMQRTGKWILGIGCMVIAGKLCAQSAGTYDLHFNTDHYTTQKISVQGTSLKVRAYEKITYVANPVDTSVQVMNIYIPEAYFKGKSINGYNAATAPVFFPNQVGGYMPGSPAGLNDKGPGGFGGGMRPQGMPPEGMPPGDGPMGDFGGDGPAFDGPPHQMQEERTSAVLMALSRGYIVASAGARGRTSVNASGRFTGKAPAAIVDLKAAIRYLKFNDKNMPGDANKIISNGTSAGGALSALLGATGNNADYEPYLKSLGAAEAGDDIFAVSAYCPITNLDHADMAYEWQFNGVNSAEKRQPPFQDQGTQQAASANILTLEQQQLSATLKALFPAYVNNLQLKAPDGETLSLDDKGEGNFKELIRYYIITSAQKALEEDADLSQLSWLTIKSGKVTGLNFDEYIKYMQRMKMPPAFDGLDLGTGENQLFGDAVTDKKHFTDFAMTHTTMKALTADASSIKMMNPMNYIAQTGTVTAKHWRIRHGTKDKDTGLAIPVILATLLKNKGYEVDFALPWDQPHGGDYDLEELFEWMDQACK